MYVIIPMHKYGFSYLNGCGKPCQLCEIYALYCIACSNISLLLHGQYYILVKR